MAVGESLAVAICKSGAQVAEMCERMVETLDNDELATFVQALNGAEEGLSGRLDLVQEAKRRIRVCAARTEGTALQRF